MSGVGVWSAYERTFLDIRIMHPNSPSYLNKPLDQLYASHEKEKKRAYSNRVNQIEKGSFTPIVLSTFGGSGKEAEKFHKRMATLIADKRKEKYSDVVNHLRTRLRFSLLKSILIAVRGIRGRQRSSDPLSSIEFSLVEQEKDM